MAIYFMAISTELYDSGYYIGHFLKLVSYFIPFTCLIISYVSSYNSILAAQEQLIEKQKTLDYYLSHDLLTGLSNRKEFEYLLDQSIALHKREKNKFALVIIDLDNFKLVNDSMGHIYGDELLVQFTKRLKDFMHKGDSLSRVGGDEFTLITSGFVEDASPRKLIERFLNFLKTPFHVNGKLITITSSVGVTIYPTDGKTVRELFQNANIALNAAKKTGKNSYRYYTKNLTRGQYREAEIESHLREALKNDELNLLLQPIYALEDNSIIGAEILMRWDNSILGPVSPDEFIPVAETNGLIVELGAWLIEKTLNLTSPWLDKQKLLFSINISPVQIKSEHFLAYIKNKLESMKYPAASLQFEITENLILPSTELIGNSLEAISNLGIKLALDDFGKGYSSLARLRQTPVYALKIDQLFVEDIKNEKDKVATVDIIINLAKELDMRIIAEGIETIDQYEYLRKKGCDYGQGFLMSPPISIEAFEKLAFPS